MEIEFILYVDNQENSCAFYAKLLKKNPVLNVPGMIEFQLNENCKLGLMPNDGIAKIICPILPHPELGKGIPRCELYLSVENVEKETEHALSCGAILVSPPLDRDWGAKVSYVADLDGHVLALSSIH